MEKMISFEFDEEFYTRVKHNFKLYVLLSSKGIHWNQNDILANIFRLNGYKCHKMVKYGKYSSHIHVKFGEEHLASEAVGFLNKMSSDLTAVLVDDMLRDWFTYELRSGFGPPCTLTIVDVIGDTPLSLNFLKGNILNSIFADFGGPYLLPYTAALSETHVQVLFGSMTEALAACVAFGEWYGMRVKLDSFCYRVRINPSDKEGLLIRNSGGHPNGAFKLDYFINLRNETHSRIAESGFRMNKTTQTKGSSHHIKGSHKGRKHKHLTSDGNVESHQSYLANQIGHRTPILCVPVLAPLNYTEAFMATNKQFGTGFVLDFQQCCSVSTRAIVSAEESSVELTSPVQYPISLEENPECVTEDVKKPDPPVLALEPPATDPVPDVKSTPVLLPKQHKGAAKHKNTHKGHSRVFVRKACR